MSSPRSDLPGEGTGLDVTEGPALDLRAFGLRLPAADSEVELSYQILDIAPVGMMLTDSAGAIYWANEAAGELLAIPAHQLPTHRIADFIHPDDLERHHELVAEIEAGLNSGYDVEQRWISVDGTERYVSVRVLAATDPHGRPLRLGDELRPALVRQVVDVTERHRAEEELARATEELRRRNEELERSNGELAEFAYVVSHDLSEPLRVISGHAQLLARRYEGQLDETAQRWIDFVVDGCARMRALIDDVLLYSRAGQRPGKVQLMAVRELVRQAGISVGVPAGVLRSGPLPEVALPMPYGQVFANLIGNALKFQRPGEAPAVEVSGEAEPGGWRFVVADNGPGIPERHRERVFRLFQRLHTDDRIGGTGAGLAICRKVVQRFGGRIWVEDAPQGGAAFVFTVPTLRPEPAAPEGT